MLVVLRAIELHAPAVPDTELSRERRDLLPQRLRLGARQVGAAAVELEEARQLLGKILGHVLEEVFAGSGLQEEQVRPHAGRASLPRGLDDLSQLLGPVGDSGEVLARLAAAMAAGVVLGINRDLRGKPAGVRTHGLVSIGACLVTVVTMEISQAGTSFGADAVSRVVQGIITGIGFIGGGVILKLPDARSVHGLTTAASVWITACLGIAFGAGMWRSAVLALGLTFLVLLLGGGLEELAGKYLKGRQRPDGWERE